MAAGQQLWFEVAAPAQARTSRTRSERSVRVPCEASAQLELRMVPSKAPPPIPPAEIESPMTTPGPAPESPVQPFGSWLLEQGKRPGSLGDIAKAARADRLFPKNGTGEDVRKRFNAVGADGDAFEALDDAEREYDRLVR